MIGWYRDCAINQRVKWKVEAVDQFGESKVDFEFGTPATNAGLEYDAATGVRFHV